MALTTLVGTKWLLGNDFLVALMSIGGTQYNVNFKAYNPNTQDENYLYSSMTLGDDMGYGELYYDNILVATTVSWNYGQCATVLFLGGEDADNSAFISLLENGATLLGSAAVLVSYNGEAIAAMMGAEDKTLKTSGKYCEGDIIVSYTPQGSIATATFSVQGESYYTDDNMTVQHSSYSQGLTGPVGSLVFCIPPNRPEPGTVTAGVRLVTSRGTTYRVYEVTG